MRQRLRLERVAYSQYNYRPQGTSRADERILEPVTITKSPGIERSSCPRRVILADQLISIRDLLRDRKKLRPRTNQLALLRTPSTLAPICCAAGHAREGSLRLVKFTATVRSSATPMCTEQRPWSILDLSPAITAG